MPIHRDTQNIGEGLRPAVQCRDTISSLTPTTPISQKSATVLFLAPPYVRIERGPDSRLFCHNPGFGCNRLFVSIDELTPDNINRICTYHPRAMLGGEIESYQTETIPIFLHQLSKLFPEQYSAFIKAFPDYELKAPDYRGKYAKLSTCNRELIYRDAHGQLFPF